MTRITLLFKLLVPAGRSVSPTTVCRPLAARWHTPTRNPWFSGGIDEMRGNIISLVNTSERAAQASLCYSEGNLYSIPSQVPQLSPICSHAFEVQIPPFGTRRSPVERGGATYFSMTTQGNSIVLQMPRPLATGVKVYSVDSTIKFGAVIEPRP